jgi:hypothetical protein
MKVNSQPAPLIFVQEYFKQLDPQLLKVPQVKNIENKANKLIDVYA